VAGASATTAAAYGVSDPNWFYSTVAQSSAAIVGLAGGFMINRLTAHRVDIAPAR
jgi:hypothetical protein